MTASLHPPLAVQWTADPGLGFSGLTPACGGGVAVVGADRAIWGLGLEDGSTVFHHEFPDFVVDLAATAYGPVTMRQQGLESILTAFSWSGETRWSKPAAHGMASQSLRGAGEGFLALGLPRRPGARPVVTIYEAASGAIRAEYPNPGDLPDLVSRGLLSSVRADDAALGGLFLYDIAAQ